MPLRVHSGLRRTLGLREETELSVCAALKPFFSLTRTTRVLGDADRRFHLTLENVSLALHEAHHDQPVLDINQFDSLTLREVRLANSGAQAVLNATRGNRLLIERLTAVPENRRPHQLDAVESIEVI